MKERRGFVSNSSSSSFIVALPSEDPAKLAFDIIVDVVGGDSEEFDNELSVLFVGSSGSINRMGRDVAIDVLDARIRELEADRKFLVRRVDRLVREHSKPGVKAALRSIANLCDIGDDMQTMRSQRLHVPTFKKMDHVEDIVDSLNRLKERIDAEVRELSDVLEKIRGLEEGATVIEIGEHNYQSTLGHLIDRLVELGVIRLLNTRRN